MPGVWKGLFWPSKRQTALQYRPSSGKQSVSMPCLQKDFPTKRTYEGSSATQTQDVQGYVQVIVRLSY